MDDRRAGEPGRQAQGREVIARRCIGGQVDGAGVGQGAREIPDLQIKVRRLGLAVHKDHGAVGVVKGVIDSGDGHVGPLGGLGLVHHEPVAWIVGADQAGHGCDLFSRRIAPADAQGAGKPLRQAVDRRQGYGLRGIGLQGHGGRGDPGARRVVKVERAGGTRIADVLQHDRRGPAVVALGHIGKPHARISVGLGKGRVGRGARLGDGSGSRRVSEGRCAGRGGAGYAERRPGGRQRGAGGGVEIERPERDRQHGDRHDQAERSKGPLDRIHRRSSLARDRSSSAPSLSKVAMASRRRRPAWEGAPCAAHTTASSMPVRATW